MDREIAKELALKLADIDKDGCFIKSVFRALDTDDKREQMLNFINASLSPLKKSDVYLKEGQINGELPRNI